LSRNQILIAVVVAALIVVGAAAWYVLGGSGSSTSAITASAPATGTVVTADDRTLGNPKAKVTVIEYAAPMCPHCAHMNAEGFPILKSQYIDTGKVFYIFRVFPIGQPDLPAEAIARCLPKDEYFHFMDILFRNQDKWDPENGVTDVEGGLIAMGHLEGLTTDQVKACMADKAAQARTMAVAQDAGTRYGVTGTPTFVINGEVMEGGAPWDDVKAKLDATLAKK
jgi:protein-disulfide isomerase